MGLLCGREGRWKVKSCNVFWSCWVMATSCVIFEEAVHRHCLIKSSTLSTFQILGKQRLQTSRRGMDKFANWGWLRPEIEGEGTPLFVRHWARHRPRMRLICIISSYYVTSDTRCSSDGGRVTGGGCSAFA
jgi:hypothetical protein